MAVLLAVIAALAYGSASILQALGVAAALAFTALPAGAQTKVTGGIAAFNEALLPVYTAKEKGYFEAEGISLELVDFKGGGPAVQALAAGSIDICFCAADHVIRLRSRNQPALVLIDPDVLDTLPQRDLRAGYAEVVKYGLIYDLAFFEWCVAK